MALVIPPDYANWIVTITNSGGGLSSVSHIALATKNLADLDQTIVNRVANLMRDGLKGAWDSGWTVGPVKVIEGDSPVNRVWEDPTTEVGTATAAVYASPAVSLVIAKKTGLAGKSLRGRFYLPGIPETLIDEGGVIDATYLASMQTLVSALLTSVNADAGVDYMVLLHDEDSPQPVPHQITSLVARSVAGTMRPRQRR